MKDIELPITQSFSITIDTHNMDMSNAVDIGNGKFMVPLGNVVDEEISKITETARRNGGKILYATTSIEQQLESILLYYFMGPFKTHSDKRVLFEKEILQSSMLTYSAKKELISKIINKSKLLVGKKKNKLQSHLKNIMEWRNAFAHGKIQHDNMHGCFIKYYCGVPKTLSLTDTFWNKVENIYTECSELLREAQVNMENIKA